MVYNEKRMISSVVRAMVKAIGDGSESRIILFLVFLERRFILCAVVT